MCAAPTCGRQWLAWTVNPHTHPTVRGPLAACMPPPALLSPVALRIPSPITTPHPPSHHPFPAPLLELPNMACEGKVRPCLLAHGPHKPLSWLHSWGQGLAASHTPSHSHQAPPLSHTLTTPSFWAIPGQNLSYISVVCGSEDLSSCTSYPRDPIQLPLSQIPAQQHSASHHRPPFSPSRRLLSVSEISTR